MSDLTIRRAARADIPAIAALLADDFIGAAREGALLAEYEAGFDAVEADSNQLLAVAESGGAWRGHVEAVRVASERRGQGIGEAMMAWAVARCREKGCVLCELTSDKRRDGAHRFYDRLGFEATHLGYKKMLA